MESKDWIFKAWFAQMKVLVKKKYEKKSENFSFYFEKLPLNNLYRVSFPT